MNLEGFENVINLQQITSTRKFFLHTLNVMVPSLYDIINADTKRIKKKKN